MTAGFVFSLITPFSSIPTGADRRSLPSLTVVDVSAAATSTRRTTALPFAEDDEEARDGGPTPARNAGAQDIMSMARLSGPTFSSAPHGTTAHNGNIMLNDRLPGTALQRTPL